MGPQILSAPSGDLATAMRGIWWLLSREDWTKDHQQRVDPTLGADPFGIVSYAATHFAAQFMKRDRSDNPMHQTFFAGKNNTAAVGGYDAYFGTYEVNEQTGKVAHTLIGSLSPSTMGVTFLRDLRVKNDQLTLQLDTTTPEGESITRTLVWKRIG